MKIKGEKMYLGWEGGISDVLFDLKEEKLYHYETEHDSVHSKYGGENYYQSRTGLTGEGYITNFDSIILVGWYRTENNTSVSEDKSYTVYHTNRVADKTIKASIFVPLSHHKKEWTDYFYSNYPFVLKIVEDDSYGADRYYLFFTHWFRDIVDILKDLTNNSLRGHAVLGELRKKQIEIKFASAGVPLTLSVSVLNHEYGMGLDYAKFFVNEIRKKTYPEEFQHISYLHNLFNVVRVNYHYYKTKFYTAYKGTNVFEDVIDEDPLFADNEVIKKWTGMEVVKRDKKYGTERILIRKIGRDRVYLVAYSNLTSILERYRDFISEGDMFAEYEYNISKIAYTLNEETYNNEILKNLNRRILDHIKHAKSTKEQILRNEEERAELLSFIKQNPELEITFEDSVAAGNCPVGTERFAEKYFNSARKIKLIDLEKFVGDPYVNRVIRYIKEQRVVS